MIGCKALNNRKGGKKAKREVNFKEKNARGKF